MLLMVPATDFVRGWELDGRRCLRKSVSEKPDPISIAAALGLTRITGAFPVHGGSDTEIWRIVADGGSYALRLFRADRAPVCHKEVLVMRAAAATGVPVPRVHGSGTWQDRPALLLSWCAGRPLWEELRDRPATAMDIGGAFGGMQARIHTTEVSTELAAALPSYTDLFGNGERALSGRLRDVASRRPALLHLDYHPLNVLSEGSGISGVLDWANACVGDPRADIARTYTILRVEPYLPDGEPSWLTRLRRQFARGWLRGYARAGEGFEDMPVFMAWAGTVMVRDLAPRVGRPGSWWRPRHLDGIRRWTAAWKRRAGLG